MKKVIIITVLCCITSLAFSQSQPFLINNYTTKNFNAHRLIWDMMQDPQGRLWFANNDGLLRFDGNNWTLFPTPTPVRSIAFSSLSEVYVACVNDFGTLRFNADGSTTFTSFKQQVDVSKIVSSGDEKVFAIGNEIYFTFRNALIQVVHEQAEYKVRVVETKTILGAAVHENRFYVNVSRQGLCEWKGGKFTPIEGGLDLAAMQISDAAAYGGNLLIATNYGGFYTIRNNKLSKVSGDINAFVQKGVIGVAVLPESKIAVATFHDGVKLFSQSLVDHTSLSEISSFDLPSAELYGLFADHEGNLWTAHAKGLSQVLISVPVLQFDLGITGTVTDIERDGNTVYFASTGGLFESTLTQTKVPGTIRQVNKSECWDILNTDKKHESTKMLACTDGLYYLNQPTPLITNETFLRLQYGNKSGSIYAFGVNACWKISAPERKLSGKVSGINEMANSIFENEDGSIWVGTYHNGVLKIPATGFSKENAPATLVSGEVKLRCLSGRVIFQAKDGVYDYDGNSFVKNEELTGVLIGTKDHEFFLDGKKLVFTDSELKLLQNGKSEGQNPAYCISGRPTAARYSDDVSWVAFEDRIYGVYPAVSVVNSKIKVSISRMLSGSSSIVYSGCFTDKEGNISPEQQITPELSFDDKYIKIEFGISSFINPEKHFFSYKIDGLDEQWSEWQNKSFVELNGVNGGNYVLHVKARNAFGEMTEESSFRFYVRPPWYLSGYAYLLYASTLLLFIYLIVAINNKRLISKNKVLEIRVEERTRELKEEKQKSDTLLLNILPSEIAEELKQKGESNARQYEQVSVLFTDFVGFTTISGKLTPKELVNEIHYCFKAFDEIMERNGLEKIKTIGDAYLAVSGIPVANREHAQHAVQAALDIQKFMSEYKEERIKAQRTFFETRIGINSGSVIAGIVGVKKYAYDIWGDTVNVAARMEQSSEPGKINISESTYELVKGHFNCQFRGEIEAKGKGKVKMYFVS